MRSLHIIKTKCEQLAERSSTYAHSITSVQLLWQHDPTAKRHLRSNDTAGILTTSVAREHADGRIQHARASDVDKISSSGIRAESAAEDRHPYTPYLSSSRAGGFVGDAALSDSDVRSRLAQYDNGEGDPSRIWTAGETTNIPSGSNAHIETRILQHGFEENENRISSNPTRSEGSTLRNIFRGRTHTSQKLLQERQERTAAKQELWSSSSSYRSFPARSRAVEGHGGRSRRAVTSDKGRIWPSGIIPYEIKPLFSSSTTVIILEAMRTWENATCLRFVEREPHHSSYIIFTIEECGCCSFVGRQSESRAQTISIGQGCETHGIVLHELGHALGFWHEQSRPDRDEHVEVFENKIDPAHLDEFRRKEENEVDSLGEPYDFDSIMHYSSETSARPGENETMRPTPCCPRPLIGRRNKLSPGDIRQANMLYSCPSCGQTLLEFSGTFASPHAEAIRQTADANDRQQGSELSSQQTNKSQESEETVLHGAEKHPVFCQWRIVADREERIRLEFTHMDMTLPANIAQSNDSHPITTSNDSRHCIEEFVEVRDGYYSGSPLIGRYCGTNLPPTLVSLSSRMLIEYTRSAGQRSTGFVAKYTVVCGGYLKAEEGMLNSPGYPNAYLPNTECTWRIEVPSEFFVVLTLERFDLEKHPDCSFDRLEIYDGPSESSPMLRRLCGPNEPGPIVSTNNTMTLRFRTNDEEERQGFRARFAKASPNKLNSCTTTDHVCKHICVNIPGSYKCQCHSGYTLLPDGKTCKPTCGGHLVADEGTLTSPVFPRKYPRNSNCVWLIEVPEGFSVLLTFYSFHLERHSNCSNDHVEIKDGLPESSSMSHKYCGIDVPLHIWSRENKMTVRFVSDFTQQYRGFAARFEKTNCGGHLKANEGTFTSPGYPNNYPPNSKCTWLIEVPLGFSVILSFDSFKVEKTFFCTFDHIEIYDGPSVFSSRKGKLCGTDIPAPIMSTNNTMTVQFFSDPDSEEQGFVARFEKEITSKVSSGDSESEILHR
ncbi:hypothetical protein AAHC03_017265 [Spirometra sp. Aus1]